MPMIGMGIAVSVLVGQALGSDNPDMADRATFSAMQMSLFYMGTIAIFYLVLPGIFIYPFAANADPSQFQEIRIHAMTAMKFVAAWSIFDSVGIIISSTLKGAGDTKFIMISIVGLSLGILVLPTYMTIEVFDFGLKSAWAFGVAYIISLGIVFSLRYRTGKWRAMRVIEQTVERSDHPK